MQIAERNFLGIQKGLNCIPEIIKTHSFSVSKEKMMTTI